MMDTDSRHLARVACGGGHRCRDRYQYFGVATCQSAMLLGGGPKACRFGCIGLGDCARACPQHAIRMNDQGLPDVDRDRCNECGECVPACPKSIVHLTEYLPRHYIFCSSTDRASVVRSVCPAGCIGCGLCVKACPYEAIEMKNNLAVILPDKCTNCAICVDKCPTRCIHFL
jgi:electron transport complex protein RnfB